MLRNALTHMKARSLPPGKYADGQGLWLVKTSQEAGKWVLRVSIGGKRREMGLGRYPDVSIGEARDRASDARRLVRDGIDPIARRRERFSVRHRMTVKEAIAGCFEARKAELKHDGKAGRWLSPLTVHIIPKIGTKPIEDLTQHDLKDILGPIWHTKPEASAKALNRMNLTLNHAAAHGVDVDLTIALKTKALLGKQRHVTKHIPSMPYAEIPAFYKWLSESTLVSARALSFLILTAARTSELRFATNDELEGDLWKLPAERTKTGKEHRIPLSSEALRILAKAPLTGLLFPSPRGKPLSDAAMSTFLKRAGFTARPHGFRATFRTWVEEQTDTEFEVKETALGHVVDTETVRAYQRSDRLKKRATLMHQWSDFLLS